MTDPTPNREILPYRDCVGVVLFNKKGEAFIGQRAPKPDLSPDFAWQFPQGGIDKGEAALDAAIRELFEETSVKSISLIAEAPDWIYYDLPDDLLGIGLKGKYRGQRQRWFAFLFEGKDNEINVETPGNGDPAEFSNWRWEQDLPAVVDLIVPFKRDAYRAIVTAFGDLPARIRLSQG